MTDPIYEAVKVYLERGWTVVPIEFKSKQPSSNDWQKPLPVADVHRIYSGSRKNVGVLLGQHSNGLVDVDLDCTEAVRMAHVFLPPTPLVFGRFSNPRSHYLYRATAPVDTKKFIDPDRTREGKRMICELRSTGHQTVFPPSVHESGEAISFVETDFIEPAAVLPDELQRACGRLAAAVVITRHWPTGARHEAAMALAGTLHRCGMSDEQVLSFVDQICVMADDEEKADRLRAAKDTLKRANAKKKYTGATALIEIMGDGPVEAVRAFLTDAASNDDISLMNEEFKFVMAGAKPAVAWVRNSAVEPRRMIDFLTIPSFRDWLSGRTITIGKGDAAKTVRLADYWINSPRVRPTYNEVVFSPGAVPLEGVFNLWRGWSYSPAPGNCELFLDHVLHNICSGNEEWNEWVLAFLADMVQHPARKPGVCLVLRGGEGTGKTIFAEIVASLCSEHSYHISNAQHLVGKFNAHMQDCLVLVANEAFFAGDKAHEGVLKSLITDANVMVERKGYDAFQARNCIRILMTSNDDWVVPASIDSRRFGVMDVSSRKQKDQSYFERLIEQMNNGGREALLHFLMHRQYDLQSLRTPPYNAALQKQRDMTMSPVQRWWQDRLLEGDPCPSVEDWARRGDGTWPTMIAKDAMYEDFTSSHRDMRSRYNTVRFWIELHKFIPDNTAKSLMSVKIPMRNSRGVETISATRKLFLELPSLEVLRAAYNRATSKNITWPDITAENVIPLRREF